MPQLDFTQFKALVVDDNDFVRFMVKKQMLGFGFKDVFEACNGAEGFEVVKTGGADIILCDIHMEPVDGFEFLHLVRSMNTPLAKLPIIFMTSSAEEADVKKAMALEVDGYLLKPVMPNYLKQKIETMMLKKMSG